MKATDSGRVRNVINRRRIREIVFFAVITGVPIIQFCLFYIGVNVNSLLLAFKNYDALTDTYVFIGADNFVRFFTEWKATGIFNYAIVNSLIAWVLTFGVGTTLGLVFAYYIARRKFGHGPFKVILFLPNVVSGIVLVVIFKAFTDSFIPALLRALDGKEHLGLIQNPATTFGTIIFYNIWIGFGVNVLMYSGAMSGIDDSLFEAARMDGAGAAREFFSIVLPIVYPTIVVFFTAGIAGLFTNQLNLYSFFGESAQIRYYTFGYFLYRSVQIDLTGSQFGYLSAIGIMITLIVAPVTFTVRKLLLTFGPSDD